MMGEEKDKKPAEGEWVWKAPEKKTGFDLKNTKETFTEAKKSFIEAFTLGSEEKPAEEMDLSMITTFLETCIKLLHDSKAVKGLEELINQCAGKDGATREQCMIRYLGKHKARTRWEIRVIVQIGEYEMDEVILDLGSNVNVLPK